MPSLLAFIAHPDDESYSFGGLIALAARAGWRCHIDCATYGERGERYDGGPAAPNDLAETRAAELAASCRVLGAEPPRFWGLPDGELKSHRGEEPRIARAMRGLDPTLVVSLGADGAYGHPDHIALHNWVFGAWQRLESARPPLLFAAFPRGLFLPQYHKCIAMMGDPPRPAPDQIGSDVWHYALDIRDVARIKLAAIAAHRSQLPGGDPHALFPGQIVRAMLAGERYLDASGAPAPAVSALPAALA